MKKKTIISFILALVLCITLTVPILAADVETIIDEHLAAPSNLRAAAGVGGITLTWQDNSNERLFRIERKTGRGSWSEIGFAPINATTYTDSTVVEGMEYTYRVSAYAKLVDYGDTYGNYSNEVTITMSTTASPSTPESPSSWARDEVNAALAAGLVPQNLQSSYTQATTRAEYCALAVTLYETYTGAEITERQTFVDTNDVNVEKMAAVGVVTGVGNNRFDPDANLTREQAATMLARLANTIGKPLDLVPATFADNLSISDWAVESVGQVQAAAIMGGVGNNTFAPNSPYTREQSIITMIRLANIVN